MRAHLTVLRLGQIIMTANKEAVLSEKDLRCHLGQTVLVGYSEPIFSAEYPTFEAFLAQVQKSWDAQWQRINSADWSSALPNLLIMFIPPVPLF